MDFLLDYYTVIKAVHVIFVIYWMAGLLMIPRFFVYHHQTSVGSEEDQQWIERTARLNKIILSPAMHISAILGIILMIVGELYLILWFQLKILLLLVMLGFHTAMVRFMKRFALGERPKSEKYFRMMNEVPSLLIIGIILLVIIKPFG